MSHPYQDHYFHKAKKEHYLARAVYKLEEIQLKYRILKKGDRVLDLGAAPGSWMQFTGMVVGPSGLVVGIDLKPILHAFPRHVVTLRGDVFDKTLQEGLRNNYGFFDVILSDMAPSTTGIRFADSARSALLFEEAFKVTRVALKTGGHFLAKVFQGSDFHPLLVQVKREFDRVKVVKPGASRKFSKEIYVLAMGLKERS